MEKLLEIYFISPFSLVQFCAKPGVVELLNALGFELRVRKLSTYNLFLLLFTFVCVLLTFLFCCDYRL